MTIEKVCLSHPQESRYEGKKTESAASLKLQKLYEKVHRFITREIPADSCRRLWDQVNILKILCRFNPRIRVLTDLLCDSLTKNVLYMGKGMDIHETTKGDFSVYQGVRWLFGKSAIPSTIINQKYTQAFLLQGDPTVFSSVRDEFYTALQTCAEKLPRSGSKEEILFQTFIGNIIGLIPYCYPSVGQSFIIPQKINGEWKKCDYVVDSRFDMSPKWLSTPMSAYGLTSNDGGPPILTFLGTTYPSGEGFCATFFNDMTPGMSVGHAAYLYGKSSTEEWMNKQEKPVNLYGVSLGGAICLQHLCRGNPEKIGSINAYNPAGLYPWDWSRSYDGPSPINIYYQENDIVAGMGSFPTGKAVTVYRIFGPKPENFLRAHAIVYSGAEQVLIAKSSPEIENAKLARKIWTAVHFATGFCMLGLVSKIIKAQRL